jgi:hypothetical protein
MSYEAARRPNFLNDAEQESGGESEEQASVQGLDRSQKLPAVLQKQVLMPIARHGIKRIEHRGFKVWQRFKKPVRDGPDACLDRVQTGRQQRSRAHYYRKRDCGMAPLRPLTEHRGRSVIDEAETEYMDEHVQYD